MSAAAHDPRARTWLAVVNPAAGFGRAGKLAPAALERLRGQGLSIEEARTGGPGDATRLVREAYARGIRQFISVGGDGTSYEIVNGLLPEALHASDRPWLGFLPLGTGNSFLRDFTDRGAEAAAEALVSGARRPCDVVRLEHTGGERYFINLLSAGFVADVGTTANRRFKALGPAGYVAAVVLETVSLHGTRWFMHPDGDKPWSPFAIFISFNNSRFTGGRMMMAPYANTADGKLDVIVVGSMSRGRLLSVFPSIFQGKHVYLPEVTSTQVTSIALDVSEPVDLMIDGEVERYQPKRLTVVPSAIDVCI